MPEDGHWLGANGTPEEDYSECPACGSVEIDNSVESLDPVCQGCGVIVTTASEIDPDGIATEQETSTRTRWVNSSRVTNSTEQRIASAFETLEEISGRLDLPTAVRKQAAEIYAEAATQTLTDGRSTEVFIAACITAASRESGSPVIADRVARIVNLDPNSIRSLSRELRRELDLSTSPCPPEAYLDTLAKSLELDRSIQKRAEVILESVPSRLTGGRHPGAFAGAALYTAADGDVTQRDVARVTGVTPETIGLRVKDCREVSIDDEPASLEQSGNQR